LPTTNFPRIAMELLAARNVIAPPGLPRGWGCKTSKLYRSAAKGGNA
jgi:hypothetical protein